MNDHDDMLVHSAVKPRAVKGKIRKAKTVTVYCPVFDSCVEITKKQALKMIESAGESVYALYEYPATGRLQIEAD